MKRILSGILMLGLIVGPASFVGAESASTNPVQLRNKMLEVLQSYRAARNHVLAEKSKAKSSLLYKNKLTILNNKIKYLEGQYARQVTIATAYERAHPAPKAKYQTHAPKKKVLTAPAKISVIKKPAPKKAVSKKSVASVKPSVAPVIRRAQTPPPVVMRPVSQQFAVETAPAPRLFSPAAAMPKIKQVRSKPVQQKPKGPSLASRLSAFTTSTFSQLSAQWKNFTVASNRRVLEITQQSKEWSTSWSEGARDFQQKGSQWVSEMASKMTPRPAPVRLKALEWTPNVAAPREAAVLLPEPIAPLVTEQVVAPVAVQEQTPEPIIETVQPIVETAQPTVAVPAAKAGLTGRGWTEMDETYKTLHLLSIMSRLINDDIIAWKSQGFYAQAIDEAIAKDPSLLEMNLTGIFLDQLSFHEPDTREAIDRIRKQFA